MKRNIMIVALLLASMSGYAKKHIGIYLTATDYQSNKVSFTDGSGTHLNNSLWPCSYVTVVDNHKKQKLKKSELYGYRNSNNEVYRFYNNAEYKIAEAGNICIYIQTNKITQNKGYKVINAWYFSTSAGSAIYLLNLENLKIAYKDNEKIISLLDQYCSHSELSAYDNLHKTFSINYLFSKALK